MKPEKSPFTVLIDTREQLPFEFASIESRKRKGHVVEVRKRITGLSVGDYMPALDDEAGVPSIEVPFVVERKSKADLYGTLGGGRDRFMREVERARRENLNLHIVTECSFLDLLTPPARVERVTPRVIIRTVQSWAVRFPWLHWWFPGPRQAAEQVAYRLLEFAAAHAAALPVE